MTPTLRKVLRGTSRSGFSNSAESWAIASQPKTAKTRRWPRAHGAPALGREGRPVIDAHTRDGDECGPEQQQGDAAAQDELHPRAYPEAPAVGCDRERQHRRSQQERAAPSQP